MQLDYWGIEERVPCPLCENPERGTFKAGMVMCGISTVLLLVCIGLEAAGRGGPAGVLVGLVGGTMLGGAFPMIFWARH